MNLGTIINTFNSNATSAVGCAGGIIGNCWDFAFPNGKITVNRCGNAGIVKNILGPTNYGYAGGIASRSINATITNYYNLGIVETEGGNGKTGVIAGDENE